MVNYVGDCMELCRQVLGVCAPEIGNNVLFSLICLIGKMTEGSAEAVCKLMLTKPVCVNIGMGGIVMCFAAAYHRKFNKRLTWNQLKELHNIVFLAPRLNNLHRSGYSLDDFEVDGSLHVAFDKWLAKNIDYLAFCATLEAPATFDFIR